MDIIEEEAESILTNVLYDAISVGMDVLDPFQAPKIPFSRVDPSNTYLTTAVLSGACALTGLSASSDQRGEILVGLKMLDDYALHGPEELYEVRAIHACIQLLVGGMASVHVSPHYPVGETIKALRKIESEGVIRHDGGKRVLKVSRMHALRTASFVLIVCDRWQSSSRRKVLSPFQCQPYGIPCFMSLRAIDRGRYRSCGDTYRKVVT